MIITDEKQLKIPCSDITDLDGEGMPLLDQLHEELVSSDVLGIGLAANQIGVLKRAFVLQIPDGDNVFAHSFINPRIEALEGPVSFFEGCLSYPNDQVETLRFTKCVVVDALAPEGRKFEGLAAIAAQHETDHTSAITMYDRRLVKYYDKRTTGSMYVDISPCPCGSKVLFERCCKSKLKKFRQKG